MSKEKRFIELKAVFGKQQGPLSLNPARDATTGALRGVKVLSEDERRKSPRIVDADTTRKITDGLILDLEKPVDAIDWAWIKECKEISASWDAAKSEPAALFYIFEPDKDIDERINKSAKTYKAMKIVYEYSLDNKKDLCKYLGNDVDRNREKDIDDYLISIAQKTPEKLVSALDDVNYKTKVFLFTLLHKGILQRDKSGAYRYEGIIIGLNETAAIHYLNDERNRDLVGRFYTFIYGEDGPAKPASVIDQIESLDKSDPKNTGASGQAGKAAHNVGAVTEESL